MRILLDECVTKRLKPYLQEFEVVTVSEMKCNGIKNGKLMSLCIENDFDLILTIDKNLMFQQNLDKCRLTIAILNSLTSKIEELILFMPLLKCRLKNLKSTKLTS
jgi:hypothetical protein